MEEGGLLDTSNCRPIILRESLHLDVPHYRAADDWFHLAPGMVKRVSWHPCACGGATDGEAPSGEIRTLGSSRIFAI